MKPNFALTLSFDGIGLLHRSDGGWLTVWDVQLNDTDLAGAFQVLVSKARALEPSGITTKVVIPNQQIRYLTFESDSRDVDILEAQVRNTLNGATPYDLSELAYDWSMTGGEVCVAAVAIETLTEAESFAVDHGLGPMSFVAIPDDGAFQGEPFFGETVHAGEVLQPGDSVERDEDAIAVVGKALLPEPDPEPEPKPEIIEAEITALPETAPDAEPISEPDTEEPAAPMVGFQSARTPRPIPPAPPEAPEPAIEPEAPATTPDAPSTPMVAFASARKSPETDTADAPTLPEGRLNPGAADDPKLDDIPTFEPEPPTAQPIAEPSAPPAPSSKAPAVAPPEPPKRLPPAPELPAEFDSVAQEFADTLKESSVPIRPFERPGAPASKHPGKLPFLSRRTSDGDASAAARPAAKTAKQWAAPIGSGLSKAREMASGLRRKPAPTSAAQRSAVQAAEDERQRMTVFGARNPANTTTESNPRFVALAVTAGLLLLLVGIAAWAAIFLEGGLSSLFRSSEDVQFAQEPAAIEAPADVETDDEQVAALPQDPQRDTEELADEPLITLDPDDVISEELSADEVRARYAATGIWQRSPQQSQTPLELQFEDVYQTSLDPDLNFSDAVALPDVALLLPSARPASPGVPLRPGEDGLERDSRGFVLATPDGVVTLDGITIFAGPPPILPPATPERAEPPEPEVAEVEPETEAETETTVEAALPSENVGLRPRSRPGDLIDSFERSNNGGRTLDELQTIKPRARPQSAQEQALAEAGISPEIEEDGEDPFVDATEEAVAVSLKPRLRPANFAAIVEETRETAASEPVSIEQRVAVSIPTTASVARAATERNQIALRRVNLIGVYGSADSRRALVRLPNGRYQKVQVGDKLDGGQVAAIGADELRYIKRGQSVVLKMPRS